MKILFISWWFPYPPNNGSRIRIFNLLKQLTAHHTVTLLTFSDDAEHDRTQIEGLTPYCADVHVVQHIPFTPSRRQALLGLFSALPRSFVASYSREMQALVNQLAPEHDLILASQVWTSQYALRGDGGLKGIPKVLEELETAVLYEGRDLESDWFWRLRYRPMWWKHKRLVRWAASNFDGITVVSERELRLLEKIAGPRCPAAVVPNGVDLAYYQCDATPQPNKLIFSGALTFFANYGAMDWFLRDVYPLIRAKVPEVHLDITGGTKGVDLNALPQREGVNFTGYLLDIRPAVAESWVSVVPLQVGGGTRLKILEALALGTPVVSTTKGAEGLDLRPGEDILIADEPAEFAQQTVRLLRDPGLRARLAANGRRAVARYDWSIIGDGLHRFLEQVVGAR